MRQVNHYRLNRTVRLVAVTSAILISSGEAQAVTSFAEIITSVPGDTARVSTSVLYDSLFASTPGGFAVGSTSPNFGGSAMATASSTRLIHAAQGLLIQSFTLPSFVTSGRLTFDFRGYAYATGQAAGAVAYALYKPLSENERNLLASDSMISSEVLDFSSSGPVRLERRHTFTIFGGETIDIEVFAAAQAGFTEAAPNSTFFLGLSSGPGYATAFMDPIVTFTAGVPEPGTWAMMIAGFGVIGLAARRRRAVHV